MMTAQPADPPQFGTYARFFGALFFACALPSMFVGSYLLAVHRNTVREAEASAVAVAAVVVAWLVACLWVSRHDRLRSGGLPWAVAAPAVVPLGVLVAMLLDLVARNGSSVGIWAAVPAVVMAAFTVVLGAFGAATRPSPAPKPAALPEVAEIPPPSATPEEAPRATPMETTMPSTAAPEAAEALVNDTPSAPPLVADPEEPEAETPSAPLEQPEAAEQLEEATSPLDGAGTQQPKKRKPSRRLAVEVDESFWAELERSLSSAHDEQGGVALTSDVDGVPVVVGVVLPRQVAATSVHCEFSVLDVERVRDALDSISEAEDRVRITWLHTHPNLSVFLSGTDVATSANWRPAVTAAGARRGTGFSRPASLLRVAAHSPRRVGQDRATPPRARHRHGNTRHLRPSLARL